MKDKIIIGCDISKKKLDFYCNTTEEFFICSNDEEGFDKLITWMNHHQFSKDKIVIAFEHTGSYGKAITNFCIQNEFEYYAINALEIKLSQGIVRGKNDKIDAKRIAIFLYEKGYKLIPSTPLNSTIERLKLLRASRDLLIKQRASLLTSIKMYRETLRLTKNDIALASLLKSENILTDQIQVLEEEINNIIEHDRSIKKNYKLLLSIVGIGKVIAIDTIIATNNFKNFNAWRKYASYCGCAPFEKSSGIMKSNNRISSIANKVIKSHLSSGAKSAMMHDQELKQYTIRKLNEGKSKKCITNTIRCKLISRMFSVIKNQSEYKKNYTHNLAIQVS
jgi:transposase